MRVLSIDPGYERLGIAIIEKDKEKKNEKEVYIYSETFQTSSKLPFVERLLLLGQRVEEIIKEHKPDILSIEKLFFNTNQKTATNVAETRGVIIYLSLKNKMKVYEYTPLEIKLAVGGHGRADKKQVIFMVKQLISITKEVKYDDEYDAIAVGLTFFAYNQKI
jgi:crossover junction endodeoxyribonuclease RuvC